jgi:hypothetical protein
MLASPTGKASRPDTATLIELLQQGECTMQVREGEA